MRRLRAGWRCRPRSRAGPGAGPVLVPEPPSRLTSAVAASSAALTPPRRRVQRWPGATTTVSRSWPMTLPRTGPGLPRAFDEADIGLALGDVADDGLGVGRGQHDLGGGAARLAGRAEGGQPGREQLPKTAASPSSTAKWSARHNSHASHRLLPDRRGQETAAPPAARAASATSPGGDLHPVTPHRAGGGPGWADGPCRHWDQQSAGASTRILGLGTHFAIGLQFVPGRGAAGRPAADTADPAEWFPVGRERCLAHVLLFMELRTCRWHGQRQHGISTATRDEEVRHGTQKP